MNCVLLTICLNEIRIFRDFNVVINESACVCKGIQENSVFLRCQFVFLKELHNVSQFLKELLKPSMFLQALSFVGFFLNALMFQYF